MNHTTLVRMLHALANLKHLAHTRSRVELARIGIGEQVATTNGIAVPWRASTPVANTCAIFG